MAKKFDLYEFKMALFDHGNPEEFLLFVWNFQTTFEASGTIAAGTNIQYLLKILRGEALCQLDTLYFEVVSTTTEHLDLIIWF